ncbi:MAG: hypothetical protein ABI548_25130 [Polyangiaceae bacterium]
MKFCLTIAAIALLGAVSLEAHAQQPWLADRQYGEGIGVRVGNLEFHPGIAGEVGYDSNYYLRAPSEDPIAVYRFRVTPSASLSTLGPQRRNAGAAPPTLIFRTDFYAALNAIVAADSKHSSEVSNQGVNADFGYNLSLNLFPAARFGEDAYFNFVRVVQPSNATDAADAFNRDTMRYGGGVTWRPGGGLFDWRLGYEGTYNYFEKDAFSELNNYTNAATMRGRWRFLPRTAVLYDGSYTWVTYPHTESTSVGTQNDGQIMRSRIGLNGLITNRFAALAMVGWAGTFYDAKAKATPQEFDSLTAQAELKWFISAPQETLNAASAPAGLSTAAIGYLRDVNNSYLGNFYRTDRGYANVSYLLGGVFIASLTAGLSNLAFPTSYFPGGKPQQPAFSEQRFDASLFTEYRLSNSFGLNTTVNYVQNITDVKVHSDPTNLNGPNAPGDALAYSQWQVFLGARYFL